MLMVWFGLVNVVQHHFEQYFSYIVAITTTTAPGMLIAINNQQNLQRAVEREALNPNDNKLTGT
jgi:hypothetical protein